MIPSVAHFVWLGTRFPWLNALAVVSAAKAGGFERVVVHASDDLDGAPYARDLRRFPSIEIRPIELGWLARRAGQPASRVRALYDDMTSAAARSDVLRTLVLAAEGGVYLDVDTVTIAPFDALRASPAFVGQEWICFPEWSTRRHSMIERGRAYGLSALRSVLALLPEGHLLFARVQHLYSLAVNNAVLGSEPGHPFIRTYLEAMLSLPAAVARKRYAIGPELLARVCRERAASGIAVLPPRYFFPLGPVISESWWARSKEADLASVLSDETVTVHWYASVRSKKLAESVDPAYVRQHRDRQLFSKLASRYVDCF
jgi:hypothetical protein